VVHSLTIKGTDQVSPRTIKGKILTTSTGWWPFAAKKYFDPLVWEADLRRIERLYQARGFYRAHITGAQVIPRKKDQVDLVVTVAEEQPTPIRSLEIRGLDPLPADTRARVLARLPLSPGQTFVEDRWDDEKSALLTRLRARGYAEARVTGEAIVDLARTEARLGLLAVPGERYRFADITVNTGGGNHVDPQVVREQVLLALDHDYFSDDAVDEAQRRVFGMGVFSSARVTTGPPDRAGGVVPLLVTVREAPLRTLRLGGGIGIEQVRQEARLVGEWTNRNFLGGLRRLTLNTTAGWAFIPTAIAAVRGQTDVGARNGPIYRARADFEQPRFLGRPSLSLKNLIESERTLEPAYDAIGGRTQDGVSWQPYSTLTVFPAYNLQGYSLHGTATPTAQSAPLSLGCRSDPCFVLLSYLEEVVTWDRRNNPLEPRRGHYLSLSLQEGGGPLQGDFTYLRLVPEGRAYLSFGEQRWVTMAARLQVGTLLTRSGRPDDSAVVTRFTAGGANSNRGFSLRRLTPLLLTPAPDDPNALLTLPIGGNGVIDGSLEVRFTVLRSLVIALFTDFGAVSRDALGGDTVARMQWAAGVGLRYLTPVGPIRVDLGFRLPSGKPPALIDQMTLREVPYAVNRTCFGIGPSTDTPVRDGLCAFHISIGESF
jgi:translocation and assembly module TamA